MTHLGTNPGRQGIVVGYKTDHLSEAKAGFQAPKTRRTGPGTPVTCPPDAHEMIIGPTGAGKTVSRIIPLLLEHDGPAIVMDVKGELFDVTARHRAEMGQEVLLIDPFRILPDHPSTSLDPAQRVNTSEDPLDEALILAEALAPGGRALKEAFWTESGNRLNAAGICHCAQMQARDRAEIQRFAGEDGGPEDDLSPLLMWYSILQSADPRYAFAQRLMLDDLSGPAQDIVQGLLNMPSSTGGGVLATAQHGMRMFGQSSVRRAVAQGGIDLASLKDRQDYTIYIAMPPKSLKAFGPMLRIWFEIILQSLLERREIPEKPTLVVVDEAGSVGRIPSLELCHSLGRGFGIKAVSAFQSVHQVSLAYGAASRVMSDNAGLLSMYLPTNFRTARELSEIIGYLTPETFLSLDPDQLIAAIRGRDPMVLRQRSYLSDPALAARACSNPRHGPAR